MDLDEALSAMLLPFKDQNLPTAWRQHPREPLPPGSNYYSSLAVLPALSPPREGPSRLPMLIALQCGKMGYCDMDQMEYFEAMVEVVRPLNLPNV
ncbi:hypothetical protein OROMI_004981 [Orobanche minor]